MKGSKIITLRIPDELLVRIQDYITSKGRPVKRGVVGGFSEWIRESIEQRLGHVARSSKSKKSQLYRCDECGTHVVKTDVACTFTDLYGKPGYRCRSCDIVST